MPANNRWFGKQAIKIPANFVLGLAPGFSLPPKFGGFSDANGYVLRHTAVDGQVGDKTAGTNITFTSSAGGGHNSSSPRGVLGHHTDYNCGNNCYSTYSLHTGTFGNHTHSVQAAYESNLNNLNLIVTTDNTDIPEGGVFFSIGDIIGEGATKYGLFNNNTNGLLAANAATAVRPAAGSASFLAAALPSHRHLPSGNKGSQGCPVCGNHVSYHGGVSHTHSPTSLTMTPNTKRMVFTAWTILAGNKLTKLDDIIGMYMGAGVPEKWELVAEIADNCMTFAANSTGASTGTDTIQINSSSTNSGHNHTYSNYYCNSCVGGMRHTSTVNHSHTMSINTAYVPPVFKIKFIRYIG